MTNLLLPEVERQLEKLSKWHVFSRIELIKSIRHSIQQADQKTEALLSEIHLLKEQLEMTNANLSALKINYNQALSNNKSIEAEKKEIFLKATHLSNAAKSYKAFSESLKQKLEEKNQIHQDIEEKIKKLDIQFLQKTKELSALSAQLESIQSEHKQLASQHKTLQDENDDLQSSIQNLKNEITEKRSHYNTLQEKYDKLGSEHLTNLNRYNLICDILNAKPDRNEDLDNFKSWVRKDFTETLQHLELPAAVTLDILEKIGDIAYHVELLNEAPELHTKTLIAVAGGFSTGKSTFISSLMPNDSKLLAVGVQPVTAIPTYVMNGDELKIHGHNFRGADIDLSKDHYKLLTHEFIRELGFNLTEIMPHVIVRSRLCINNNGDEQDLENLALIDTPGYNPAHSDAAHTDADMQTAGAVLREADAIIWLVALDHQGTIPESDIEFLQKTLSELEKEEEKQLYIVLNKVDLKNPSQQEAILDEVEERLNDYNIHFSGICAYSSLKKQEYKFRRTSFFEFLSNKNLKTAASQNINKDFRQLFAKISRNLDKSNKNIQAIENILHEALHDTYEISTLFQSIVTNNKSVIDKQRKARKISEKQEDLKAEIYKALKKISPAYESNYIEELKQNGINLLDRALQLR